MVIRMKADENILNFKFFRYKDKNLAKALGVILSYKIAQSTFLQTLPQQ